MSGAGAREYDTFPSSLATVYPLPLLGVPRQAVVRIGSPGGMVADYGLAAAQLLRLRSKGRLGDARGEGHQERGGSPGRSRGRSLVGPG